MTRGPPEATPPDPRASGALLTLFLVALISALAPAALFEVTWSRDGAIWTWVTQNMRMNAGQSKQALVFEAVLQDMANHGQDVLVIGNSIVSADISHEQLRDCCGRDVWVGKVAMTRLSMLEVAMLGPVITEIRPQVVVLSFSRWDALKPDSWHGLRYYDPSVAFPLSTAPELFEHRAAHLSGLLDHSLMLFRHRRPMLELAGDRVGLPITSMLEASQYDEYRSEESLDSFVLGAQTRALRSLARRFNRAAIRLVVVSPPSGNPSEFEAPEGLEDLGRRSQRVVNTAITEMASDEGFLYLHSRMFGDYGTGLFQDFMHMNPEGRRRFTATVSEVVNGVLRAEGDTWLQMGDTLRG